MKLTEFINEILFINEVNYSLNIFMVCALVYFMFIFLSTDPMKPRRKTSGWKLKILILILYSIHTCFSVLIVCSHVVNITCPTKFKDFTCLEGEHVDSAIVAGIGVIFVFLNSYFIENIYNF